MRDRKRQEFWEGVAQKIDGGPVTRGNFLNVRHLALRVFDLVSKTRNVLPSKMLRKKSSPVPCYTVNDFSRNIVARKIVVASCPV